MRLVLTTIICALVSSCTIEMGVSEDLEESLDTLANKEYPSPVTLTEDGEICYEDICIPLPLEELEKTNTETEADVVYLPRDCDDEHADEAETPPTTPKLAEVLITFSNFGQITAFDSDSYYYFLEFSDKPVMLKNYEFSGSVVILLDQDATIEIVSKQGNAGHEWSAFIHMMNDTFTLLEVESQKSASSFVIPHSMETFERREFHIVRNFK